MNALFVVVVVNLHTIYYYDALHQLHRHHNNNYK
jgi:hypothetical protein